MAGKRKGAAGSTSNKPVSSWDNVVVESWDQPPNRVKLLSDSQGSSWHFGDGESASAELSDKAFKIYLTKAWRLCLAEARQLPPDERKAFLEEQRARLDGYKKARKR